MPGRPSGKRPDETGKRRESRLRRPRELVRRAPGWVKTVAGVVAGIGVIAAALLGGVDRVRGWFEGEPATFDIVDVAVAETGSLPLVDLTVRNDGDRPVLIHEARIELLDMRHLDECPIVGTRVAPALLRAGEYLVELPIQVGALTTLDLSQNIEVGSLEKFGLRINDGHPVAGEKGWWLYKAVIHLDYNDGLEKTLDSDTILLDTAIAPLDLTYGDCADPGAAAIVARWREEALPLLESGGIIAPDLKTLGDQLRASD